MWTLEQCIDTALTNNRNVKQQHIAKEARTIAYEQARMDLLPNLNANAGQSFAFGLAPASDNTLQRSPNSSRTSFNVSSSITLFDGLRMKHNIDAKKADLYASEADLKKIKEDIVLSVSTAFLQVLMNKELLLLAEDQLALTKESINERKLLVENGRMAEGELYELLAQEAKEELSRVQAGNALKLSLLDLAQILELDDFRNMDVAVPEHLMDVETALLSPETVYGNALVTRPEIKSSEYKLQSSEKNVDIARSAYYPVLSFGADVSTGYYDLTPNDFSTQLSDNMSTSLGFTLRIPIFNKFETKNRVRSARLEVENSKLEMENTKIALRKTVQQAYQNALAAQTRWASAGKSEKAAQEAFRFANQKYNSGRATQYELFQAKNNLAQALSEKTQAKYEYVFRSMILELYQAP
ncbi:MAG: TolC family protein [Prevotellaceae bacterium]|nr:TolC family protein [Prevotellaceae bacterium]